MNRVRSIRAVRGALIVCFFTAFAFAQSDLGGIDLPFGRMDDPLTKCPAGDAVLHQNSARRA